MSLDVNFNSAATMAAANLNNTNNALQNNIEDLSSGYQINTAADSPAGYVVTNEMQAQADGMGQAIQNANDGINLVKTADAALGQISNLLEQMRSIAVSAANAGVNSANDLSADQAAFNDAVTAINTIASTTQFNGKNLLDGTYSAQNIQIGANATDTSAVSIAASDSTTLGLSTTTLGEVTPLSLSGVDSGGALNADDAITAIDAAITTVSEASASLGALQTYTLQSTVNSLTVNQENIQSSEAAIKDTDIASTMTQFSQNNVLEQAGVSMLAQADQQPNNILKLIQNG